MMQSCNGRALALLAKLLCVGVIVIDVIWTVFVLYLLYYLLLFNL